MSKEIADGQYRAWRVTRIDEPRRGDLLPAITTNAGTLWDETEARKLDRFVNPNLREDPFTPTTTQRIREIGVIVLGDDAYYDTFLPPVPVGLIAETAEHAARLLEEYKPTRQDVA